MSRERQTVDAAVLAAANATPERIAELESEVASLRAENARLVTSKGDPSPSEGAGEEAIRADERQRVATFLRGIARLQSSVITIASWERAADAIESDQAAPSIDAGEGGE